MPGIPRRFQLFLKLVMSAIAHRTCEMRRLVHKPLRTLLHHYSNVIANKSRVSTQQGGRPLMRSSAFVVSCRPARGQTFVWTARARPEGRDVATFDPPQTVRENRRIITFFGLWRKLLIMALTPCPVRLSRFTSFVSLPACRRVCPAQPSLRTMRTNPAPDHHQQLQLSPPKVGRASKHRRQVPQ